MGRIERGDWVGDYQIVGQHWDGALGEAWGARCDDPADGRPALVLIRRLTDLDDEARGRLIGWAGRVARIDLEGVGRVVDVVDRGEDVLLLTELVPGESLRQVARAIRRWPLGLAVRIVAELGRRLDALYDYEDDDGQVAHLTHGSLDATTILLDYETFDVVVTDPGLQSALRRGQTTSRTDDVLGLGRILYELATGAPCPEGKVPTLRSQGVKAPKKLEAALRCAVAPDARKRYAAPSGFVRDLDECLSERAREGELREAIGGCARTKVQNRLQGTRTLVARWSDAPSPRLPSRPGSLAAAPRPVSARSRPLSRPAARPLSARRSQPLPPPPPAPEASVESSVSAFVEPLFKDVTPVSPGLAMLPPVPHPDHVLAAAATDDLAPLLEPEPKAEARPEVLRLLRQLTLLGILATVAIAGWAYFETAHAQSALDVMRAVLGG